MSMSNLQRPTSNVQRPTWIQPAMAEPREEVSLYTHPRLGTPRTPCEKNLRWKFGDHCRPPSTRPPSSCHTPSASSTPWPHGSAPLFWSLSNPPPPPSQLIFLTRILHCLSFKKVFLFNLFTCYAHVSEVQGKSLVSLASRVQDRKPHM